MLDRAAVFFGAAFSPPFAASRRQTTRSSFLSGHKSAFSHPFDNFLQQPESGQQFSSSPVHE